MKATQLLHAGLWLVACNLALAQAPAPAKKTAKTPPAATTAPALAKPNALGAGNSKDPLLTRDELRVCLKDEENVRLALADVDGARVLLDKDRVVLDTDRETLKAERAPIDKMQAQAVDFGVRSKAFTERAADFQRRANEFKESGLRGEKADTAREALVQEQTRLETERLALEAERVRLKTESAEVIGAYNTKAQALEGRVTEWNGRNGALNARVKTLETQRQTWIDTCADRRFREDDEKAIRSGK